MINQARQTNPFDGAYQGLASHVLDLGYLLRNFDPWLDEQGRAFGEAMLALWVGFAYGEDKGRSEVLALGPDHEVVYNGPEDYNQRYRQGRVKLLLEIGLSKAVALGERLQGVVHPEL